MVDYTMYCVLDIVLRIFIATLSGCGAKNLDPTVQDMQCVVWETFAILCLFLLLIYDGVVLSELKSPDRLEGYDIELHLRDAALLYEETTAEDNQWS